VAYDFTIFSDSSVEPSSTTMHSQNGDVCLISESSVSPIVCARLKLGVMNETTGSYRSPRARMRDVMNLTGFRRNFIAG
jgi:hypothetical protein